MRILLVEDAADVAETVAAYLERDGFACDLAGGEAEANGYLDVQSYDLVILDIHLPDGDGRTLLRAMRRRSDGTPVLMLSANYSVETRVGSLDEGADDYLVKPFDLRELSARVRALTRRGAEAAANEIALGDLLFDQSARTLRLKGEPVAMTRRELALFNILLRNADRIVSKERLFEGLFSFDKADVGLNAIELYVARIRKKLADSAVQIRTHRGLGYSLEGPGRD
ncbi:two-component system, OmpR family, response regulator TctD [Tranquillimonas rosea]|uniref:Two-component system, OmpR family, response regulator TctD n=1 Tax=Tranquillimonas rosea TaxID=641238 RepID=A0A1H9WUD0_9RHOB|nr:response regulator transcription factor [Tranquillimonas rosea]SES37552.1 two-component system, OmpR family, response regulator TctD [Tranquillimonas rosea]